MSLRLLKVNVQVVLVDDDGDSLSERTSEPISVSARDWPAYPAKLAADIARLNEPEKS